MEWFRISRNKRNEAEQVVAAEEKQKPLGCLPVLIPKLDPPIRNARKRRATADEIKPSKDEVVATQVADTAHRKTNKRRRDTPDDERYSSRQNYYDLYSDRIYLGRSRCLFG